MVRLDNCGHDIIDFCDVRLVDVLTQNPVKAGDWFSWSLKSRELVRFLSQVGVHYG